MKSIHESINKYYTGKITEHGPTPQGVDWRDEPSQLIRIAQLLRIVQKQEGFSINDLGCGYGRLLLFLTATGYRNFTYRGYDLSQEMIRKGRELAEKQRLADHSSATFAVVNDSSDILQSDYTIASGIFNVKMEFPQETWLEYILLTIGNMNQASAKGFSFNALTKYSDHDRMRKDLYYADPCFIFDYCKTRFSRNVALLHDYDLYEFTVLVRK